MNHELAFPTKKPEPEHPVDYYVPDFGVDQDIKDSLGHLKAQENIHGPMSIPGFIQLDSSVSREPLLSRLDT